MFTVFANTAIETIQSTKKIAVDTFVKHEGLSKALNSFVDSQTEYTKNAVAAGTEAATSVARIFADPKFYTESVKMMQDNLDGFFPKKGK